MGNTPSSQQGSPARPQGAPAPSQAAAGASSAGQPGSSRVQPNLRLPMPQRPTHISPQSSNPTSPSGGRSGSPRRRKSLELPDLNRLSFTPAAPVPTTATHTNHHLAPTTAAHAKRTTTAGSPALAVSPSSHRWKQALGGRASPLAGANALSAMSRLDSPVPAPRTAPVTMPNASVSPSRATAAENPYFPTVPHTSSQARDTSPLRPIPVPSKDTTTDTTKAAGVDAPPPTIAPTPPSRVSEEQVGDMQDGLVNVPIQWTGGGKVVYVAGNFADNWKGRIKLKRSTHDFNTVLRLPPGQYRLKFIVDDSWRCSKQIPTASDDDGTLVNWMEVEAPKSEEELKAEWALDTKVAAKHDADSDQSQWTTIIPAPLYMYQYLEEIPHAYTQEQIQQHFQNVPHLSTVPSPPHLPRILDKVIVNAEPKKNFEDLQNASHLTPAGLDDNSILAVPNHVVLNHLTASAIKNGTLGVGTTTRYRKKYITTMFFKPTLADLMGDAPPAAAEPAPAATAVAANGDAPAQ
ncbi:5'-AMP-activated protein kinase beta subunit, interation domain-domain-containing protein [Naematelia encephala]|uniref:5'-AMP-activated protein kinase beta subunit, interation domain-domain-containing protein n=1 Tax=Naematelia encephala TaxID=71784 RepID=A0A1Y2AQP9_9TREE|nr:5'-AMP-activated protein kinase beta subunit, interation domain-domain-containing protein [Naematelia encephala]